jgi:hypothetical protein
VKMTILTLIYLYILTKKMMKQITKTNITVTLDRNLNDVLNEEFGNKSRYIEWLIFQDMKQKSKNEKIKNIII